MRLEKKTTPSRQAKRVAHKSIDSVSRRRLADEEWTAKWHEIGWPFAAMISLLFVFVTIMEVL